jgi:ribosomal-protein-alanine N-acetyltransferase
MAHRTESTKTETLLTYSIRPMVKEDIAQVTEIDREAFPTQWPPANYQHELQDKMAHYLVVCDDGKIIDIPLDQPKKRFPFLPKQMRHHAVESPPPDNHYIVGFSGISMLAGEAHVTNLAVRRAYRGRGLGELLLIATVDLATELKATFMTLEVRVSNTVAQQLYSKYGFLEMGLRRAYYLDNREDALIMTTDTLDSLVFQELIRELREALKKKLN